MNEFDNLTRFGCKTVLHQCLLKAEFYGDVVYKCLKIRGRNIFSDQLRKIIIRYKRIDCNLNDATV